jgi:4-carboxymuconolactone decarboxylase
MSSTPLPSPSDTPAPTRGAGEQRRRQVMGDVFVDRALSAADAFSRPLQQYVNEHAWGSTWLRDGLDLKQRSLCTVAMLAALGRSQELKGHLRGALNNGATLLELREVLLHVAPYAGAPAAIEAFRAAREWLAEQGLSIDDLPDA